MLMADGHTNGGFDLRPKKTLADLSTNLSEVSLVSTCSTVSSSDFDPGNAFQGAVNAAADESSDEDELDNGLFYDMDEYHDVSLDEYFHSTQFEYTETENNGYSLGTIEEEEEPEDLESLGQQQREPVCHRPPERLAMRSPEDTKNTNDNSRKISNSNLLESIFDDLDDELEKQYYDEEVEFFHLETQVIAEELVDETIRTALDIIAAEQLKKRADERIAAAKSEIVAEKLMRPSEIRKSQRVKRFDNTEALKTESETDSSSVEIMGPIEVQATVEIAPAGDKNEETADETSVELPAETEMVEIETEEFAADQETKPLTKDIEPPKTKASPEPIAAVNVAKVQDSISISKSSAAGSSLTKNTKRRKSFRLPGRRRSSLKDSSLKLFSCLVSEVKDIEDASITSLKSEMPKNTKYQEKNSCAIM